MRKFWPNSNYQFLSVNQDQQLIITDDFLRSYLTRPEIAGKPIYLAMAHDIDKCLKFKPQNLLINLPLAETS